MKTNLLITITFLFLKFGYSQDVYYPLIEEGKLWYIVETGFGAPAETHIFKCEGDSTINDEIYKIVYITWDESLLSWIKAGYIREDENHKVYYSSFHNDDPSYFEPALLYDFNAAINDSLTITSFPLLYFPTEIEIVITDIDSVLVDGSYHRRTWYDCGYDDNYWIEGIGSNNGLIELGFYCTVVCPTCDLQCVKTDGVTIYPDGYTGSCYIVGIDELNPVKTDFNIYPNPADGNFVVLPHSYKSKGLYFELYNYLGSLKLHKYLSNNSPTNISVENLQTGIYIYKISDDKTTVQKGKIMIK